MGIHVSPFHCAGCHGGKCKPNPVRMEIRFLYSQFSTLPWPLSYVERNPNSFPGPRTQDPDSLVLHLSHLWPHLPPCPSSLTVCSGNLRNPAGPRKWSHVCSYYQASSYSLNLESSSPRYSTSIALSGASLGSLHNCCLMGEAISSGHILGGIWSSPLLLYLLTFFFVSLRLFRCLPRNCLFISPSFVSPTGKKTSAFSPPPEPVPSKTKGSINSYWMNGWILEQEEVTQYTWCPGCKTMMFLSVGRCPEGKAGLWPPALRTDREWLLPPLLTGVHLIHCVRNSKV